MADLRRVYRGRELLVVAAAFQLVLAGCAVRTSPPPRGGADAGAVAPAAPSEAVLAAHARLIRLEDRRELDLGELQALAGDTVASIRARTALALGRLLRPEGAPLLLNLLADPDTAVAATAAFALGQLGDSAVAPRLVHSLKTSLVAAPTVAAEAAYALGKVGGSSARSALTAALDTLPMGAPALAPVVESALLAIWRLAPLSRVEAVTRWLQADDPEVRWRAAYAVARGGGAAAVPALVDALKDAEPRVRAQALRGLTAERADSAGVARSVVANAILPLLEDVDYAVAVNAARALGSFELPVTLEALTAAVSSSRRHVALAAIESLGRVGSAARVAALLLDGVATADSIPPALRAAAAESLTRVDSVAAAAVAQRLSVSPEWRLRAAAGRVAARLHRDNLDAVRPALEDPDPRVAAAALQALVEAGGDDLAPLRKLLVEQVGAQDAMVRTAALNALARDASPDLLPLLLDAYERAASDSLPDAALAALDAIGAVAREGLDPTRAFLGRFERADDPLVRQRAVERLDSVAVVAAWGAPLPIDTSRDPDEYRELVDWLVAPALAGSAPREAILVTRGDTLRIRLFAARAPLTVENFLKLADAGYFDRQEWPRVVSNFVVQGGDPRGDTSGGPGYSIRDEINRVRYGSGTVGMALAGPDTGGSQFFITHSPQPHLDGTYTVFGEVVAGQDATHEILPGDQIELIRSID